MGITQMDPASQNLKAEDQFAVWSFTGWSGPYGTDSSIVAAALAAVQAGFSGEGFEILTLTGITGQEFIIKTSEPSILILNPSARRVIDCHFVEKNRECYRIVCEHELSKHTIN